MKSASQAPVCGADVFGASCSTQLRRPHPKKVRIQPDAQRREYQVYGLAYRGGFQFACGTDAETDKLTPRELEVLQSLAKGNSYKMVADELGISIETVRTHIKRIYEKLHVHSVAEAIAKAYLK